MEVAASPRHSNAISTHVICAADVCKRKSAAETPYAMSAAIATSKVSSAPSVAISEDTPFQEGPTRLAQALFRQCPLVRCMHPT